MVKGPRDLASFVYKDGHCRVAGQPGEAELLAILEELYRLSLTVDEGRYAQILFAYPWSERFESIFDGTFVPFGSGKLHLAEIVSLAPAIAQPPFALVLRGNERCAGIVRLQANSAEPGWYFAVRGPGEIEVALRRREREHSWILSRGACWKMLDLKQSKALLGMCNVAATKCQVDERRVMEIVLHVIRSIAASRHGGALLVTEDTHAKKLVGAAPADAPVGESDGRGSARPRIVYGDRPLGLLGASGAAEHRATAIACLSQIDGAMLFDQKLQVWGAGIFVVQQATKVLLSEPHADSGESVSLEELGLGSRHRSAAWFCKGQQGAVAVVISQDQAVRLFAHNSGEVSLEGPYLQPLIPS